MESAFFFVSFCQNSIDESTAYSMVRQGFAAVGRILSGHQVPPFIWSGTGLLRQHYDCAEQEKRGKRDNATPHDSEIFLTTLIFGDENRDAIEFYFDTLSDFTNSWDLFL